MVDDVTEQVRLARKALEDAQALLKAEIGAYPGPIAGCDAQFNRLLEHRQRVTSALSALDAEVHVPTPRAP